jgi:predicted RNA-binding protein with PIN domain
VTRWIVDGMNVIGSRPTGWWRDRQGAMRGLAEDLARFAAVTDEPVTVIFDGRAFELDHTQGVEVLFASRMGPNAADDDIAALVAEAVKPEELRVITSDETLARRVRDHGAETLGAGAFRRRLDEIGSTDG